MHGKVALITGSAKGLGKKTALTLAEQGCHIALNYVHSKAEALSLQSDIERLGVRCIAVQADVSRREQIEDLARQVNEQLGTIDILVNNAGPFIRERKLFADYSQSEVLAMIEGNLVGSLLLDHLVLPGMREKKWGRIIHFGFGHAAESRAWPHRAVYAAAKTGLVSFTKTLAVEEAPYGITVNMVCPGDIRGNQKEMSIHEVRGLRDGETPLGRPGSGEDIARVIAFLCHPDSDFITGNIMDISGGLDPIRPWIKPS
ncbi:MULTISPECIES: SDR family oxidoreductase [Paenibacillus]|uniref:3-oxoacyl-[acyl-carrier protein] reductase n=2 Tax=Paenibacillus barengoltzii TaxID=343517 RepID=R9LI30_9BACL|nr:MULTISPECIES: SDR family oxidoreductase [Paenibacillus]EOS58424.1 3-oxoacyl-[acyl-carrier protein] reductase [Paenibacillus barengoltzii G22]MDU0331946.1 SDR family oxidoreductase [Paenibacillus sp. 3LSP]MEC2343963.1 SDR family oxidoreductase [Paenibacillus barengoltzii]SMF32949.1 3-oxoacyl-[acyl-carrier protein] reductase [Paenibacillus barengoltzii]SMF49333.1 3-oxoacyl-[acyl-carrier protein] reductase [Paenibacillus barengoltzii J12]